VISATFSWSFRGFKGTMLQFALMLLSANALKCNAWVSANGQTTDLEDQTCMAAAMQTTCASYSYKITLTGQTAETVVNQGGCGTANFCSDLETATKLTGAMSDFKCTTCDSEKCNTKSTGGDAGGDSGNDAPAGGDGGNDTPAAEGKKSFYYEEATGEDENSPMSCMHITTANDCTVKKFTDVGVDGLKEGSCPAKYTTKCALKFTEKDDEGNDEVTELPSEMPKEAEDIIGCGKVTMAGMTEDCDACQKQKEVQKGATFQKDPTCEKVGGDDAGDGSDGSDGSKDGSDGSKDSSGSALAFGVAALVASLFY